MEKISVIETGVGECDSKHLPFMHFRPTVTRMCPTVQRYTKELLFYNKIVL